MKIDLKNICVDQPFIFNSFIQAEKAGRVSIRQMKLACQIGDPILLARCRVYMAQSLMQNGFMQHAMFIVR